MPTRAEVVSEAADLLALYRDLSDRTPPPRDFDDVGTAIAQALEPLNVRATKEVLERAAEQLAAVRETLTRIRRTLDP